MAMRDDEYFAIKRRAAAVFLKIPDVTAVGLGARERNGGRTGEVAIKVFVKRKKPANEVPPEEMIGIVDNIALITAAEVDSGTYQVRKRGAGSRLTGGVLTAVGGVAGLLPANVRSDAILIRPNPNPAKPGEDICFSHFVDRGAVVVNSDSRIVGVLYDEIELPHNGITMVHGVAAPIQTVFDAFESTANIKVTLRTANAPDDVHTTSSRLATELQTPTPPVAEAPEPQPRAVPAFPGAQPGLAAPALASLHDELSRSGVGRMAIDMWIDHRGEIRDLIDHNRKVATVWHRSGGPALLQALIRAYQTPSATVPAMVNGLPIAVCIDRIAAALCKYGSPHLQGDVAHLRALLPSLANRAFADILASASTP
jgi:hypothetical protein